MAVLTPAMQNAINLLGHAGEGDEEAYAQLADPRTLREVVLAFWVNQFTAEALEVQRQLEIERARLKANQRAMDEHE